MIIPPFSITGIQHKHFRDGVDIEVTYTRNGTHITHINSVRFAHNFSTLEQNYNCEYVTFLNNGGSIVVGGKRIELVPRVGQIIVELENTFIDDEINERILAGELPSLTDIESSIDIGTADGGHRTTTQADFPTRAVTTYQVEQDAQTDPPAPSDRLPPLPHTDLSRQEGRRATIPAVDAINLDGSINLQAIGIKSEPNPPPAPIRKPTRWELLELD